MHIGRKCSRFDAITEYQRRQHINREHAAGLVGVWYCAGRLDDIRQNL